MALFTVYRLGRPHEVVVDDADLVWVSLHPWRINRDGYVYRDDPDRGQVRLHREIMAAADRRVYVDHVNGNRLDNRRANLRFATPQQNAQNNAPKKTYRRSPRPSGYKGVSYRRGRWRLNIKLPDGRRVDRLYRTEEEAARAYDRLAAEHHGTFARRNFPPSPAVVPEQAVGDVRDQDHS